MAEKNFKFQKISLHQSREWNWNEKFNKEGEYVKNGEDNLFPQHLIDLYNRSSVHASCVNAIVEGVVGGGLTANDESYIDKANYTGESWNDIFAKAALDFKLHGSFALEVIYTTDRSRIAEVYHIDYSYVRAQEKDHRGHIPGYYVSAKWKNKKRFTTGVDDDDILYLPVYNPLLRAEQPSQVYVYHNYRPGQEYYALPDYVAALRVIELDTEIDNFHTNNIKNGLAPSLAITTFTNGSDDQLRAIEEQLNANYGGTDNAGSLMYMDVASRDDAPIITPIQPNNTDTYYTDINDLVMQKLLTAHRITSPMILGIKTEGQLGGRTEVLDAYILLQNIVLAPMQQDLLKCFEKLLAFNYPDIVLGIEQKKLYDDGTEEVEIVTDADTTYAEQDEIEENIEDVQPELLA